MKEHEKMKMITACAAAALTALSMNTLVFAGQWKENDTGWWYDNGNGTWPSSSWRPWKKQSLPGIPLCCTISSLS